ncbi:MAG: D-alanine--D-alanine ligase [Firmicutes bacterium ADurb.Bin182]|nr:MAG: D-alanine--D-alanine ligase [Firmicutes bacterium ADurb.Bin182]
MINLGVLFGSRAAEHDVSIVSGLQILENADKSKYNAFPVYISRSGEWFIGERLRDIKTYRNFDPEKKGLTRVFLPPVPGANGLYKASGGLFSKSGKVCGLDCAILAMHGMHGEDGTLQGLFELADIPYSSCGVTGSALGMDKIVMKGLFRSMGLPVLSSKYFLRSEWRNDPEKVLDEASKLGFPLFIKPANLGSSIGIAKASDMESLRRGLDVAAGFDRRILVEKGIDKPVEINCACLGYDRDVMVSLCEQPSSWEEFLTFEDKYTRGEGSKGMKSLSRMIPAPISDELTKRIQDMTCEIFRFFECKGVVRIDYLMDKASGDVYVNEINTIPGSFAFYLYEPMGLKFRQLIDKLVEFAYKALDEKRESGFAFESEILSKAMLGVKPNKLK